MTPKSSQDSSDVTSDLMKRLIEGSKPPPVTASSEPSSPPPDGGAGSGASSSAPVPPPTVCISPPDPPRNPSGSHEGDGSSKGKPMAASGSRFGFLHVMLVLSLVAGVFTAVYETPLRNAALQNAAIEKAKQESHDDAEVRKLKLANEQIELNLKIAKVTGMAPQGFVSPSMQSVQQPAQQAAPSGSRGTIHPTLKKSFTAFPDFTYVIEGNESGTFALVMYAPHEIKSIEGEYKLIYGHDKTQKTEWVKSQGPIPEEVKQFLEDHKQPPGGDVPIGVYTRGRVIINT